MDDQQKQTEILAILKDIAELLRVRGMDDKAIDQTIFKIITEVEMAVVEEILEALPPEKRKLLDEMGAQNKSTDEIAKVIKLDPFEANKIELRKFKDVVNNFMATLKPQK
jgi:hypothetical protein